MLNLLRGIVSALVFALNTTFWCALIYVLVILKLLLPGRALNDWCSRQMVALAENWISCNDIAYSVLQNIKWQIVGLENLSPERSYLVCANHRSWTDIVALQKVLNRRIPFLRFFMKQELIYVPLLGLAWQALDFPRMKRHSKEYLEKYPEKRGEDLATTRRFCERLKGKRISVLNFLEGTRITEAKHKRQQSPFQNLLKPKVGGLAFVLEAMGEQFHSLLDVTIYYPAGTVELWGMMCGQMSEVIVHVREIPIPKEFLNGDYLNDAAFRERMQAWVQEIWDKKDALLSGFAKGIEIKPLITQKR